LGVVVDKYIDEIIKLAYRSFKNDEIPVGAIIVRDNQIIGRGINNRERDHSITGHAEINAINDACNYIGDWRLDECVMYVTLKPCLMCSGAIIDSRVKKVYYLCDRTNVCYNKLDFGFEKIVDGEYSEKYVNLLKLFFENKRI